MSTRGLFTSREERRHGGQLHFAEITVRAEPCIGESEVIVAQEVLKTLESVFGPDFDEERRCIHAAVACQIASINVGGQRPHAGSTPFHAEVVDLKLSGNGGKELSVFLLSVAGMDAIGKFLCDWEQEQSIVTSGEGDRQAANLMKADVFGPPASELMSPDMEALVERAAQAFAALDEEDLRIAVYQSTYIMLKVDLNAGWTEDEVRVRHRDLIEIPFDHYPDMQREACADALAGLPMRYKPRANQN